MNASLSLPLLASLALLTLAACSSDGQDPQAAAQLQDRSSQQTVGLPGTQGAKSFAELVEEWNEYQTTLLLKNAGDLETTYLQLKENPPINDKTGKPIEVTPAYVAHMASRSFGSYLASPAINTFLSHTDGNGGASIGGVTVEKARLRVAMADSGLDVGWFFFSLKDGDQGRPAQRFSDEIATGPARTDLKVTAKSVAYSAYEDGSFTGSGEHRGWMYEKRPLVFSTPTCITCHTNRQVGDVAGVMVYLGKTKSAPAVP